MAIDIDFRTFSGSYRRECLRTKMHVGRSLSCCHEKSIEVLGLQSGVGGDQQRSRLAQRGTAVTSRNNVR